MRLAPCAVVFVGAFAAPALAYIDAGPTLGRVIQDSTHIVVLQVDKVDKEKGLILYRKVADLKGEGADEQFKHRIGDGLHPREPKQILDWAEPGKLAVCFISGKVSLTCIGHYWYECAAAQDSWWTMARGRSELSLASFESVPRLRDHVAAILAGKEVVVTAIRHGTRDLKTYEAVAFKHSLRGKDIPLWS